MKTESSHIKHDKLFYPLATIALFSVELYLAFYVHDSFFRPIFGDFLAVIFAFTFFKLLLINTRMYDYHLAMYALLVAYFLEFLQKIDFLTKTGLIKYQILKTIIGHSFSWYDLMSYTLGYLLIVMLLKFRDSQK